MKYSLLKREDKIKNDRYRHKVGITASSRKTDQRI